MKRKGEENTEATRTPLKATNFIIRSGYKQHYFPPSLARFRHYEIFYQERRRSNFLKKVCLFSKEEEEEKEKEKKPHFASGSRSKLKVFPPFSKRHIFSFLSSPFHLKESSSSFNQPPIFLLSCCLFLFSLFSFSLFLLSFLLSISLSFFLLSLSSSFSLFPFLLFFRLFPQDRMYFQFTQQ